MISATKVLLSVAVIGGGGGVLIYSSMSQAEYYKHVNEVTASPDQWEGKSLKVHGFVEAGSLEEHIANDHVERTFVLEYKGQRLQVRHKGPKPDTFRDLAEVVAAGKLVRDGDSWVLDSNDLMAKCPSKYEQDKQNRAPPSTTAQTGTTLR